jgi:F-type H+-transporting ATPase subunit gamma
MANLKEIRTRIASVKSTRQITSAMKMVAAAKLRRSQENLLQLRPYAEKLAQIMTNVGGSVNIQDNPYAQIRPLEKVLIVTITSNKGLCGGFNSNVTKNAVHLINDEYAYLANNDNVDFFAIGKKGYDFLKLKKYRIVSEENQIYDHFSFENVTIIANKLMKLYSSNEYDKIVLVYNHFKNAAVQELTIEQFLPFADEENLFSSNIQTDYIFEPDKAMILNNLIPRALRIKLYKVLLDSITAEFGARMTAMHQATDNASDLLRDLTLQYNKARQASITKEILEIVSGAEALKAK